MDYQRHTARLLHQEHLEEVAFLERLEAALRRQGAAPPGPEDSEATRLLGELARALDKTMLPHLAFEEAHIFPRLAAFGEADIGDFLTSEHEAIREVGQRVTELSGQAGGTAFTPEAWARLRVAGLELVERIVSHVQKEEMGLLPMIEELLEDEEDSALAAAYLASH